MSDEFKMWTIYWNPTDYPGTYVVRKFSVPGGRVLPGEVGAITKSIEIARLSISPECIRIARDSTDDPAIVESWI